MDREKFLCGQAIKKVEMFIKVVVFVVGAVEMWKSTISKAKSDSMSVKKKWTKEKNYPQCPQKKNSTICSTG